MGEPIHNEAELRHHDRAQRDQQYSYDLTKQLTFFVVSAELVFCGYILLNAKTLGALEYSSSIFLLAGVAALSGILWRFVYNTTYHHTAHGSESSFSKFASMVKGPTYYTFIGLSLVFFIFLLAVGYTHLSAIEAKANALSIEAPPKQLEPSDEPPSQESSNQPTVSRVPNL